MYVLHFSTKHVRTNPPEERGGGIRGPKKDICINIVIYGSSIRWSIPSDTWVDSMTPLPQPIPRRRLNVYLAYQDAFCVYDTLIIINM